MTHITIETALLEQLVGALEVSKRWHNGDKYRYGKPQQRQAWTAQSGELDTAITAGRAALEGAERVGWQPTCKQDLQVLFPRHTPHRIDNWTIAPAFLTRVLHTIAPDTPYDFIPTMEQVEQVLLAIEVIPTAEYIAAPAPVAQRVEALVMPNDDAICEALIQRSDVDGIAYDAQGFEAGYKRGRVDALDSEEEQS